MKLADLRGPDEAGRVVDVCWTVPGKWRNLNLTDMKELTDDLLGILAAGIPGRLHELTLHLTRCEQLTDLGVRPGRKRTWEVLGKVSCTGQLKLWLVIFGGK
ncbi:unnamed protein product [Durusdinium trenchii]|uniref:Uncharacterized protein n=1 Tax=Durusdinium trenchii TaxID=1381693 RepID=A0ABP0K5B6_9DINO